MPAVERAVRVLRALQTDGGRRLSELSLDLGLSKSSLSELLATMEESGIVERDPDSRAFRLGPALVELGLAARRDLDVASAARRQLDRLRDATGETAILHVPSGGEAVIVAASESRHQLKVVAPLGHRLRAFAGSVAKVLLAELPEAQLEAAITHAPLPAFTGRSVTGREPYLAEVRRVRQRGYAVDDEEYLRGVRAVSAPVAGEAGGTVAVITVVGASSRVGRDRLRPLAGQVMAAAAAVSEDIGARLPGRAEGGVQQ